MIIHQLDDASQAPHGVMTLSANNNGVLMTVRTAGTKSNSVISLSDDDLTHLVNSINLYLDAKKPKIKKTTKSAE